MKGFSARLHVKHGQILRVVPPYGGMPIVYRDFQPDGIEFYVGHTLFVFHVGEFEWRYDDEIELMLEVCSPVGQESYLRLMDPRLTVRERPYFQ